MNTFVTLDNLKQCESRFRAFMESNHGVAFDSGDDVARLRKLLYGVMQDIRRENEHRGPDVGLRELNNATLNAARDAVLVSLAAATQQPQPQQQQQQQQQHPPRVQQQQQQPRSESQQVLARDRDVFGAREVRFRPFADPDATRLFDENGNASLERSLERAERERERGPGSAAPPPAWTDVARPTQTIGAMDAGEFESRLAELANARVVATAM